MSSIVRVLFNTDKGARYDVSSCSRPGIKGAIVFGLALISLNQASAKGSCDGGGFSVLANVAGNTIAAASLGPSFSVKGKYVEFDVDSVTFGIRDYALTGAPNPENLTGGN